MDSKIFIVLLFASILFSCNKNKDEDTFDRKAMLSNMASAVIKPSLATTASDLNNLHNAATTFSTTTNVLNLTALRDQFMISYKSFQHCKMYNFGPMLDYGVKTTMNTYPTDTLKIESNVSTGTYTIAAIGNVDAIGFPALDYLLYAEGLGVISVVDSFFTSPNALKRRTYLTDITGKMKTEFDQVITAWTAYEASFVNADGNDFTGSTSLLFNEMVKDIELLKNAKVGIPAGQQTGGQTLPTYVEGYFSQSSIDLAKENVLGLKIAFHGGNGIGLDNYIRDVEDDEITTSLADNILAQFDVCTQKFNAIPGSLSAAVDTSPTEVLNSWNEIKKLLTYCKTDMSSTLGLLITFQDNDGD